MVFRLEGIKKCDTWHDLIQRYHLHTLLYVSRARSSARAAVSEHAHSLYTDGCMHARARALVLFAANVKRSGRLVRFVRLLRRRRGFGDLTGPTAVVERSFADLRGDFDGPRGKVLVWGFVARGFPHGVTGATRAAETASELETHRGGSRAAERCGVDDGRGKRRSRGGI